MNRVEQILKEHTKNLVFTKAQTQELIKAQEQTALEFSKWFESEGWIKCSENGLFYKADFDVYLGKYTLDQLFNEWKNQTT